MHPTDGRSPARARIARWALLAALVGVWAYGGVALSPAGASNPREMGIAALWPFAWLGAYAALPGLLAVWAALSSQPLIARLPLVAGIAALLGLMLDWGYIRNVPDEDATIEALLSVLAATCLQAIALAPLRWRYGWHVTAEESDRSTGRVQFSIGRVLVWTAATAALLGFATWIVSDWDQVGRGLRQAPWLGVAIGLLVFSLLSLLLVIPSVGLILSEGRRRGFGIWLVVVAVLVTAAWIVLVFGMNRASGAPLREALFISLISAGLIAGFLVGLLGSLLVVRTGGFRLVRRANSHPAPSTEPLPDEVTPGPSEPSR